jgi:hypothetical protein
LTGRSWRALAGLLIVSSAVACDEKTPPVGVVLDAGKASVGAADAGEQAESPPRLRTRKPRPPAEQLIREQARSRVAEGYDARDEIIESLVDLYGDDYPDVDMERLATRATSEALAAHRRAEATWKGPTDCDRLDAAFARLEKGGIFAREKYADCQNCGVSDISAEMEEAHKKGRRVVGYVFFHDQDVEGIVESRALYLSYGAYADDDEASRRVGDRIVNVLRSTGLDAQWSGSVEDRIQLVDLTWHRRRHGR